MNSRRLSTLLVVGPAALALAACSSTTSAGHGSAAGGKTTASSGTPQSSNSSSSAAAAPAGDEATKLATTLKAGAAKVRTAHLALDVSVGGQHVTGSGDEQVDNGKVKALQIAESLPGGMTIRIVHVGDKTYAKLPTTATSSEPYVLVSEKSSNATVRSLATSIDSSLQSASVDSATVFANAASSVENKGKAQIEGVDTTHYSVVVDPQKLPSTLPGKSALSAAGIKTIPVEVYVDDQGRPVQVTEMLTVAGHKTSTKVTITRYDKPVHITAPPANQVQTG